MTLIRESPTVRETSATAHGRPIIIELHSRFLVVRLKGLKGYKARLPLTYGSVYIRACEIRAAELRREKSESHKKMDTTKSQVRARR